MVSSLNCVANDNIADESIGDLFGYICSSKTGNPDYCNGVDKNGTSGVYGAYSMCKPQEQLSWIMNSFYEGSNKNSQACDFGGNATSTSPNVNPDCSALLNQAGAQGTGTVTSVPTGTGSIGATDAPGAPGSPGASSSGAASGLIIPAFDFGILFTGMYATVAALVGAGMILL